MAKRVSEFLQNRSKWTSNKRNAKVGNVVILKAQNVLRNKWSIEVIIKTITSSDGNVRSVIVRTNEKEYVCRRRPSLGAEETGHLD